MPIASITSALRSEPSAYCWAAIAERLASVSGGLVLRSLSHASPTCTSAPATAAQPSTGLARNRMSMNTSEIGDSMSAPSTG